MAQIGHFFEAMPPWTATSRLPGGEFPAEGFNALVSELIERWPFLSGPHARRLARAYGRRVERFLKEAKSMDELGPRFAGDLTGAECAIWWKVNGHRAPTMCSGDAASSG